MFGKYPVYVKSSYERHVQVIELLCGKVIILERKKLRYYACASYNSSSKSLYCANSRFGNGLLSWPMQSRKTMCNMDTGPIAHYWDNRCFVPICNGLQFEDSVYWRKLSTMTLLIYVSLAFLLSS